MKSIDNVYPGLKDMLSSCVLSIRGQNRYALRTATDQRGEQTFNKDAKTMGGIKGFASNTNSVLKWTLNKSFQSNTRALLNMCGLDDVSEIYRPLRPSQVLQSEAKVANVIEVLSEEYINPFGTDVPINKLLNLSSGTPVPDDIATTILEVQERGISVSDTFRKKRLEDKLQHFPL